MRTGDRSFAGLLLVKGLDEKGGVRWDVAVAQRRAHAGCQPDRKVSDLLRIFRTASKTADRF